MTDMPPQGHPDELTIFETEDGKIRIEVRFDRDNVWLTQRLMAELYECSVDNISLHLRNIFKDKELDERAVTEDSSVTEFASSSRSSKMFLRCRPTLSVLTSKSWAISRWDNQTVWSLARSLIWLRPSSVV